MNFPKMKLTDVGKQVLTKVLAGASVKFTHFVLGNAACPNPDDWVGLTAPISPVMTCDITGTDIVSDCVVLRGEFSNANAPESFLWYEQCVYGSVIDDEEYSNVMIYYGNAIDHPEYVPGPDSPTAFTYRWSTPIKVSSSASVSATVQSITYATLAQLSEHSNNQQNPHNVTKDQIGLGNVVNAAPNDMVVNFDCNGILKELAQGENLFAVISKLASAIVVLQTHLMNQQNPHKVTAALAGAAEKDHRSTGTEHGLANYEYFGHVKLSDSYESGETSGNGIAVTPYALQKSHNSLCGRNAQYTGRGTVTNGDTSIAKRTVLNFTGTLTGNPTFVFIHGASEKVLGHFALLSVNGADVSGISIVDGVHTQISGSFMDSSDIFYLAAEAEDAAPENQMNADGETYNYSILF